MHRVWVFHVASQQNIDYSTFELNNLIDNHVYNYLIIRKAKHAANSKPNILLLLLYYTIPEKLFQTKFMKQNAIFVHVAS